MIRTNRRDGFLLFNLFKGMLFSHPNGGDVNTGLRKGFDSGIQDILEASNPYKETAIETFE